MSPAVQPTAFPEGERALLRHMLAVLAYRGGKAIRNAPAGFGPYQPEGCLNSPVRLLSHVNDLIEWAHRWSRGDKVYRMSRPGEWDDEVSRFHTALTEFDHSLTCGDEMQARVETLFQAPIADALTHIGQIALLRRMAGDPVLGEAYRLAEISAGRVGPNQAAPVVEFARDEGAIWREPAAE